LNLAHLFKPPWVSCYSRNVTLLQVSCRIGAGRGPVWISSPTPTFRAEVPHAATRQQPTTPLRLAFIDTLRKHHDEEDVAPARRHRPRAATSFRQQHFFGGIRQRTVGIESCWRCSGEGDDRPQQQQPRSVRYYWFATPQRSRLLVSSFLPRLASPRLTHTRTRGFAFFLFHRIPSNCEWRRAQQH
jgi:hypothetical protein